MIPTERDERVRTPAERVNGHSNGSLLSRVASDDRVILAVAGEIDLASAEKFSDDVRELTAGENGEIVLNLQDCSFIDSTGIRAVIMLARELEARGQSLVLCGLNGSPRRVFEITGLLDGPDFEIRDGSPNPSAG